MISDKLYKIFSISKDIGYKKVRSSWRLPAVRQELLFAKSEKVRL